MMQDTQ